jgi:hypothetical protein
MVKIDGNKFLIIKVLSKKSQEVSLQLRVIAAGYRMSPVTEG